MATSDLDAVFFVRSVPDVCYENGMFHVSFDVGQRARFQFVLTPNVFLKTRRASAKAIAEFEAGSAVVGFKGGH